MAEKYNGLGDAGDRIMKKCLREICPLYGKKEVPYGGNKTADIVWIGESPSSSDGYSGRAFSDEAGRLAQKWCAKSGLNWGNFFLVNAARCRINKKETTNKQVSKVLVECRTKVAAAINLIRPKLIIASGDFALRQAVKRSGITKSRGRFEWSREFSCWVLPVFHPNYIMRNQALERLVYEDLRMAYDFIQNGYKPVESTGEEDWLEAQNIDSVLKDKVPVSVDTETQGLNWLDPNHVMISYSVSWEKGQGRDIVLFEECKTKKSSDFTIQWERVVGEKKKKELQPVYVKKAKGFKKKVDQLWKLLEDPEIKKYMCHGNYDLHEFDWLAEYCKRPRPKVQGYSIDAQAAAQLLEENVFKQATLTQLQMSFTSIKSNYEAEFEKEHPKSDMLAAPRELRSRYAGGDADVTRQVAVKQRELLLGTGNRRVARYLAKFLMPALNALYVLERNGAVIDLKELPKVTEEVTQQRDDFAKVALRLAPKKVKDVHKPLGLKLTRSDLVRDILFSRNGFKLKPWKKTKGGDGWSVDKEVRKSLLETNLRPNVRTFVQALSEFSELNTMTSRYLKGFEKFVQRDGRIHTSYGLTQAVTGRANSSQPNMMNNPKRSASASKIRRLIVAPKGWQLLAIDQGQCLPEDAILVTIDGRKSLRDVMDYKIPVLSVGQDWEPSFQKVVNSWCSGEKDCIRLTYADGTTEVCSKLHRFRLWNGAWIHAEDLQINDRLAHVRETQEKYPRAIVARKGSWTGGMKKRRIHSLVGEFINGGPLGKNCVVHHRDEVTQNWGRDNIDVLRRTEHNSKHSSGEKNPNAGSRKGVVNICPVCGKETYRYQSQAATVTCSKSCSNRYFPRNQQITGGNHRIVCVEDVGVRKTYQIEVENTHTYVMGNGVISKNSELRWAADVAGDPEMKRVFRAGEDIHEATGKDLVSKPWDTLTKKEIADQRRNAKAINFGLLFGMGLNGFIRYAKNEYGIDLSEVQGQKWIDIFFQKYNRLRPYHRKTIDFCQKHGYVESMLGRRRRLPEINSRDRVLRSSAERMAINHPIQSPSSDAVLLSLAEMIADDVLDPAIVQPSLFIHDELIFEVKENRDGSNIVDVNKMVKHYMENPPFKRDFGFSLSIPLVADGKVGPNAAEMKEL